MQTKILSSAFWKLNEWMNGSLDDLRFNVLSNSISVISGRWADNNERLCAMESRLQLLINRLGGLSLPKKHVVRLTDRPDMTIVVYHGR